MTQKTKSQLWIIIPAVIFALIAALGYMKSSSELAELREELRARAISDSIGVAGVAEREAVAQAKTDSILTMLTFRPLYGARYVEPETVFVTIQP